MAGRKWLAPGVLSVHMWKVGVCLTVLLDFNGAKAAKWMLAMNTHRKRRKGVGPHLSLNPARIVLMKSVEAETVARLMRCVDPTVALLGV